jgi:hypothetical protein
VPAFLGFSKSDYHKGSKAWKEKLNAIEAEVWHHANSVELREPYAGELGL